MFVLDASAVVPLFFADEDGERAAQLLRRLDRRTPSRVPTLFIHEVTNVLSLGVRRGRIEVGEARRHLADLAELPILIEDRVDRAAAVFFLALRHELSSYDASYLELAMASGYPLATNDRALARAAEAEGVGLA